VSEFCQLVVSDGRDAGRRVIRNLSLRNDINDTHTLSVCLPTSLPVPIHVYYREFRQGPYTLYNPL